MSISYAASFIPSRSVSEPVSDALTRRALCSHSQHVPLLVELCTALIEARGLDSIGIYRVPGNATALALIQEEFAQVRSAQHRTQPHTSTSPSTSIFVSSVLSTRLPLPSSQLSHLRTRVSRTRPTRVAKASTFRAAHVAFVSFRSVPLHQRSSLTVFCLLFPRLSPLTSSTLDRREASALRDLHSDST